MRKFLDNGRKAITNARAKAGAAGTGLMLAAGAASAQTGVDTTEILGAIADSQTKGIAIATAVTVMLFLFAGVKYLRRAK